MARQQRLDPLGDCERVAGLGFTYSYSAARPSLLDGTPIRSISAKH